MTAPPYVCLEEGSSWPLPEQYQDPEEDSLEWRLRYAPELSRSDRLVAASYINAYSYLIMDVNRDRRNYIVRELRAKVEEAQKEWNNE